MPLYDTITLSTDPQGVATLTLNRPDKRNALSARMIDELTDAANTLAKGDVRAVVLSGAGPVFCAGADLDWMTVQIRADRATRMASARSLALMLQALNELPKPLIGRLHGGAFGGGVGLACICDAVIATPGTRIGLTETRLGLIPATISPYVLAHIGEGAARRIFMSAKVFDATEAQTLGIVSMLADDLDAAVQTEVAPYLSTAPGAVAAAKALTRRLGARIDASVIDDTITRLADTWEGEEAAHGIAAFLAKQPPRWVRP